MHFHHYRKLEGRRRGGEGRGRKTGEGREDGREEDSTITYNITSIVSLMPPQQSLKAFILFTDRQTNRKRVTSSMPRVNQEARSVPHALIEQDLQFLLALLGLSFSTCAVGCWKSDSHPAMVQHRQRIGEEMVSSGKRCVPPLLNSHRLVNPQSSRVTSFH